MALRTSSQSGNFNSTSTWGGSAVPVDGDQFTIAAGHKVTVNDDRRTTNGYHDSTIQGSLVIANNGQLRMNGRLTMDMPSGATEHFVEGTATSGCHFKMENGARLEIRGTDSDDHAIRTNSEKWMWIEWDGDNPNSKTTISATASVESTSLSVTSSSGFAAGDWVSIHVEAEDIDDWEIEGRPRTEGIIIHDISSNTIYPRWFVSPNTDITAASGSTLTVNDPTVFREGQKIIFGTGSNRNVKTITSINANRNTITVNSSISGSVVGETVYRTGTERYHVSGDSFQKVATPLTADANSGQAVITVASTAGMAVGQVLHIEANDPADTYWDYTHLYTISSISGNNVTLTSNLSNKRIQGAWVSIWSRDTVITSTDPTDTDQRPYIFLNQWTSGDAYYRRWRIRNIQFDGIGANTLNGTWYRGVGVNGYCSYENNSYSNYASCFDGNVWRPNNRGNNATVYHRDWHQALVRNNIFHDGYLNYWSYSGANNTIFSNNQSTRSQYTTALFDGYWGTGKTTSYNLFSRSEDYGMLLYHYSETGQEFRHNYITHHQNRTIYFYYQTNTAILENNYLNWYRYWPYIGNRGGDVKFLNSYLGNDWDATGGATSPINGVYISDNDEKRPRRGFGGETKAVSINHNWKQDENVEWGGYVWRHWDKDEGAWFVRRTLNTGNYAGWNESVYVPAGSTVYLACEIKVSDGFSGNYPIFTYWKAGDYYNGAFYDGSTSSENASTAADVYPVGFVDTTGYDSGAASAYQRRTLTVAARDHDYYLCYAVYSNSTNAGDGNEGWYQKPYEVYQTKNSQIKTGRSYSAPNSKIGHGNSSNPKKTRLGGRLR